MTLTDSHTCLDCLVTGTACPFGAPRDGRLLQICKGEYPAPFPPMPPEKRLQYLRRWEEEHRATGLPPRRSLACVHRGPTTGEIIACPKCPGAVGIKVFACAVLGRCSLQKDVGVALCRTCPDLLAPGGQDQPAAEVPTATASPAPPARLGQVFIALPLAVPLPSAPCSPTEPDGPDQCAACLVAKLQGEPRNYGSRWEHWEVTREAHLRLLEHAMATVPTYPGSYAGRGVVQGAGGVKYFTCATVGLKVLRDAGCTLPVEWWHLGPAEMDPLMRRLAEDDGVRVVDALEVARFNPARILNGWELKPYATLHSGFEEVLYLDADNVVAHCPAFLFDGHEYADTGAIFWPDVPPAKCNWSERPGYEQSWLPPSVWMNFGLPEDPEARAFESGQLLVHKAKCWRELLATLHVNEHSDWYYRFLFGDKDTWLMAWRKCGRTYAMPVRGPVGPSPMLRQHDLNGRVVFQHCVQGKSRLAAGKRIAGMERWETAARAARGLKQRWHGHPWWHGDQTAEESALAAGLVGRYRYVRVHHDERTLRLEADGTIGEGGARCEQRWSLRIILDRPTLVICGEMGNRDKVAEVATMFLTEETGGAWRGRWELHEKMPVELTKCNA